MHSHSNTSILFYNTLGEWRDLYVILAKRKSSHELFPLDDPDHVSPGDLLSNSINLMDAFAIS